MPRAAASTAESTSRARSEDNICRAIGTYFGDALPLRVAVMWNVLRPLAIQIINNGTYVSEDKLVPFVGVMSIQRYCKQNSRRDRLLLRIVDEQLATFTDETATMEAALEVLSNEELVEILIIIGAYSMLARIIRGLKNTILHRTPKLSSLITDNSGYVDGVVLIRYVAAWSSRGS
ncbi:conserved hypothetical protein [Microsporum canis CBS 113480]|uniref:Uncharacterized protein n=1 Tax=Arthroderma otae (strain ATCC MYA-4605 / CBS 113480) TaxID=554155 RepID=C5FPV7_ARTOC|nr:conserved hypothetical protein [Microsporum canis CBS 113480]EEQ31712.1 conserved hypothetical protein [Microsporum canis CBS 113480]